jgi:hypothetical protein
MRTVVALSAAGDRGIRSDELANMFGYQTADAVRRDLRRLEGLGWIVDSIRDPRGTKMAVYRVRRSDVRLTAELEPEERAELHRVGLLMGIRVDRGAGAAAKPTQPRIGAEPLPPAPGLAKLNRALRQRRKVRFVYSGTRRNVSPVALISKPVGVFLVAVEDGAEEAKEFALARMSDIKLDPEETARIFDPAEQRPKDAIHWPFHEPRTFWLDLDSGYHPDACRLLGEPDSVDRQRLSFTVTNFRAARARIYELLDKVSAVGPSWARAYLARDLEETVGPQRLAAADDR